MQDTVPALPQPSLSKVRFPGPKGLEYLSHIRRVRANYIARDHEIFRQYGDVAKVTLPFRAIYFFHPKDVRHVLRDNGKNYRKSDNYRFLKPLIGNGVVISEGELWRRQRRLIAPEFIKNRIEEFLPRIVKSFETVSDQWDREPGDANRDYSSELMKVTLVAVGDVLFGTETRELAHTLAHTLEKSLADKLDRIISPLRPPQWVPTPKNLRARATDRSLNEVVVKIIEGGSKSTETNVLTRLLAATDPDSGEKMSHSQLVDEVKTLMLAGHETTASTLSWAIYLLSRHPEVQERLAEEIKSVLRGGAPTPQNLMALEETRKVILETLRLYPSIPAISKMPIEEEVVGGYPVTLKDTVIIVPYTIHRHPGFWEAPDEFRPERFTPEKILSSDQECSFVPFSAGPRVCLGRAFAMQESLAILALLLQRYRFEFPEGAPEIKIRPLLSLRMNAPLRLKVTRR